LFNEYVKILFPSRFKEGSFNPYGNGMMPKRRNNKGKRKRKKNRVREANEVQAIMGERIPRSLMRSAPFPTFQQRRLNFLFQGAINAAAPFVVKEFRINGAFSPDTVGKPSGFNEMAAIYSLYLVTGFKIRYVVAGNEPAIPVNFGLVFRDIQPSTVITTYALAQNSLEVAPTTGSNMVGETTGQSIWRSRWIKVKPAAIVGQAFSYYGTPAYGAAVTANPTALIWCALVATSFAAGTNIANGIIVSMNMQLSTRFYSNNVVEAAMTPVRVPVEDRNRSVHYEIEELRKRLAFLESSI
jgi:hypothetical protein